MSITNSTHLSDKIKEIVLSELRSVKAIQTDYSNVVDLIQKHLELYKKSKGTPEEKKHVEHLKSLNDKKKKLAAELNDKVSDMYKDAELKVDEMSTTGGVEGYNTPFAFSGKDSEEKKGKRQADLTGYSVVKEGKEYKKGDKLKIKLPNGKKFDVVFVDYSRTKGIAYGKFKDGGEVDTKPFSLDSIVESVNEASQNTPVKTAKELADFILRHYDFATDYIDDGGQRRRAIKSNDDTVEWFNSHPTDLKKEAFKILQSKIGSSGKSQLQRVFGKFTTDK